ncbi:hypothetical protein DL240_00315 [Lujinxingia litoralis]|uniref:Water stress and hypersensitive response domain-containing protein n=1 Tax=Lujinxingia litoralis TaxID=2211119 RepID=A0A328C9R6_9DELT|nr:LEA type 2 family protein [Lujinxingia litoralis]RAL24688.1 hypothetical protein DL240_00315 [Lujinxingia litoralis]
MRTQTTASSILRTRWRRSTLGIAALAAASLLLISCAAPRAALRDVEFRSINLSALNFALLIDLTNPNEYALPLREVDWRVDLFSAYLASGTLRHDQQIPARGNARIDLPVAVRFAEAKQSATRIIREPVIPWQVSGACHIETPIGSIPVSFRDSGTWNNPLVR